MNCTVHHTQAPVGACSICGSPYCGECVRQASESRVCAACQYQALTRWNETRLADTRNLNPVNAAWLAVIPFMGAIYNGTYRRALWQAIAFYSMPCIQLLFPKLPERLVDISSKQPDSLGPLVPTAMLIFYVFTIVDAYRTARALRAGLQEPESAGFWKQGWGKFLKGASLIVLGVLFLLRNLNVNIDLILSFWPVLLIAVGGWIIWQWFSVDRPGESAPAPPPHPVIRKKEEAAAEPPAAPVREV